MKKGFLKKLQKGADNYNYGLDWVRVKIDNLEENKNQEKLLEIIKHLDTDNSNYQILYLDDFNLTLTKLSHKNGLVLLGSISYFDREKDFKGQKGVSIPIFYFQSYNQEVIKFVNSKSMQNYDVIGKIDLYGIYFRLLEIGYIEKEAKSNTLCNFIYNLVSEKEISRSDLKFDFFHSKEKKGEERKNKRNRKYQLFTPASITKIRSNSKQDRKYIGEYMNSWRLGDRQSKRFLIRAYDKLIDTNKKGKFIFYKDYFDYEKVFRLEFEFLNHFCKGFYYKDLEGFLSYMLSYIGYDKSIGAIFESKNKTDINDVKDRFKYAELTKGYMKGCVENGINIFGLLESVFESMGKTEKEIEIIFIDYLQRKKYFTNYSDKSDKLFFNILKENER